MSGTIDFHDDIIECPNCGTENKVHCISTTEDGETFNDVVAGQKCKECGEKLHF
jgi:transcription elongation factor Elf1